MARTQQAPVEEHVEDGTVVVRAEVPDIDPDRDLDVTVAEPASPSDTKVPVKQLTGPLAVTLGRRRGARIPRGRQ